MEIIVDARDMQPPEPFERTLEALDGLRAGDEVVLWLFRHPEPLFAVLRRQGYVWTERSGPDGCFAFHIRVG